MKRNSIGCFTSMFVVIVFFVGICFCMERSKSTPNLAVLGDVGLKASLSPLPVLTEEEGVEAGCVTLPIPEDDELSFEEQVASITLRGNYKISEEELTRLLIMYPNLFVLQANIGNISRATLFAIGRQMPYLKFV